MLHEGYTLLSLGVRRALESYHHGDAVLDLFPEIQLDDDAAAVRLGPDEARFHEVVLNSNMEQRKPTFFRPLIIFSMTPSSSMDSLSTRTQCFVAVRIL